MIFLVGGDFEFNPKYDEVIWSGMCYLKEVGSDFSIGGFDMSIVSKDGKFGMIHTEHWNVPDEDFHAPVYSEIGALECVYDAIYSLDSENSGRFVVFQGGKCGLVQAVCTGFREFLECREVFPCVYDRIELLCRDYCGLAVLQSGRKLFYYNMDTGRRSIFYDRIWTERGFIFCAAEGTTEVFDSTDDRLVMKSKEEIDYAGVYKNRYVFIEKSVVDEKICFYRRGNNTVLKIKNEHEAMLGRKVNRRSGMADFLGRKVKRYSFRSFDDQ